MKDYMSFGGGVQSTAIALLAINKDQRLLDVTGGKVPELYVFADTGDEPAEVYENVEEMQKLIEASGAEYRTVVYDHPERGNMALSEHVLTRLRAGLSGISFPPFFVLDRQGVAVPIRRGCTQDFKVKAIDKAVKIHFDINPRKTKEAVLRQWFGISLDEASRTRNSSDRWKSNYYPLIEMGWRRGRCLNYIDECKMSVARSACVYCPFHSNSEWSRIKSQPAEFKKAVDFEKAVHAVWDSGIKVGALSSKPYLHRSRVPIDEIDFTGGQIDLPFGMDNEFAGACGV